MIFIDLKIHFQNLILLVDFFPGYTYEECGVNVVKAITTVKHKNETVGSIYGNNWGELTSHTYYCAS